MKEIIIHIGATKTGSTALQAFFMLNKERFIDYGFEYPTFVGETYDGNNNGSFIVSYCIDDRVKGNKEKLGLTLNDNLVIFKNAFGTEQKHHKVIISDEVFSVLFTKFRGETFLDNRRGYFTALNSFLVSQHIDSIKFVVYLRPQFLHISSSWKQNVKTGLIKNSFNKFVYSKYWLYREDYFSLLNCIDECIDIPHEIVVRVYDRVNFVGGDIYHDFTDAIGLPWDQEYEYPIGEQNTSISYNVAEALRSFMNVFPRNTEYRNAIVIRIARELSKFDNEPFNITPFTKKERNEYMQRYIDDNNKIAMKYCSRDVLFQNDIDNEVLPVWKPNKTRIIAYKICFALLIITKPFYPFMKLLRKYHKKLKLIVIKDKT